MEYYRNVKVDRDETIAASRERDYEEFPEIVGGVDVPTPTVQRAALTAGGDGEAENGDEE
ncbi:MAG: hypothetical protein ICV68_14020 [Pyrinomonadaceae bacterium]|nr:hypothetical protein [Pyrinomonadaceae bacterium]